VSKVNKKDNNLSSGLTNFLLGIFLLFLLFIPGYLFYISFINKDGSLPTPSEIIETISKNSPEISEDDWNTSNGEDLNTENIYQENPVLGENFFEKFPTINSQQTYISIPMRVDTEAPPAIVIYNHGDSEIVETSVSGEFMEKLRSYAKLFTSNNYIFAASNIHDNDSLNDILIEDIDSVIAWTQENYTASENIFLIGFSRGGYTTTQYMLNNPENIKGVALLAPATYYTEWGKSEIDKIIDIPIKIWHGTDDVNIQIIHSQNFINRLAEYGKVIELSEKEGKTHYDVDDEYINEILEFFETTLQ